MAVQQKTLSNRTVATLKVERDTVFWDRDLTGLSYSRILVTVWVRRRLEVVA